MWHWLLGVNVQWHWVLVVVLQGAKGLWSQSTYIFRNSFCSSNWNPDLKIHKHDFHQLCTKINEKNEPRFLSGMHNNISETFERWNRNIIPNTLNDLCKNKLFYTLSGTQSEHIASSYIFDYVIPATYIQYKN